jgi:hypothetical protein
MTYAATLRDLVIQSKREAMMLLERSPVSDSGVMAASDDRSRPSFWSRADARRAGAAGPSARSPIRWPSMDFTPLSDVTHVSASFYPNHAEAPFP